MVCWEVKNFDVALDITGSSVVLKAVAESARLLRIYQLDIGVSFHIIRVWRWNVLIYLAHEQWPSHRGLVMLRLRGMVDFLFPDKYWLRSIFEITYSFVEARAGVVSYTIMASLQLRLESVESAVHIHWLLHTVAQGVGWGELVMTIESLNVPQFSKSGDSVFIVTNHRPCDAVAAPLGASGLFMFLFSYTLWHFQELKLI